MFRKTMISIGVAGLVAGGFATASLSAELPKSTQEMLKKLKLTPQALGDIDAAMAVPKDWIAKAKKAGEVRIGATHDPKQFRDFSRPFKERYPFIKVKYARSNRYDRVIKPLIALKSGKVIVDAIMGFGGQSGEFLKLNALADLTDIPVYKQVPDFMKSPHGKIIGQRLLTRCLSYNTKKVKKADLPETWDDILTSKRWRGKKLALVNRPDYWALHLWATKGEKYARNFLTKLFLEVKPQLRKEGNNAAMALAGAGEYDALIAGTAHRTSVLRAKGSPLGLHCMKVVPTSISPVAALKASPNLFAAKLFINWFLSREGQVAQFHSARYSPLYPDLRKAGLDPMPDLDLKGKKRIFYREHQWRDERTALTRHWDTLWFQRKGLKMQTVKVMIDAAKRGGRRYYFKVKGKKQKVRISSSRTVVTINGSRTSRKKVKKGMNCEITYPGNNETAKAVACVK